MTAQIKTNLKNQAPGMVKRDYHKSALTDEQLEKRFTKAVSFTFATRLLEKQVERLDEKRISIFRKILNTIQNLFKRTSRVEGAVKRLSEQQAKGEAIDYREDKHTIFSPYTKRRAEVVEGEKRQTKSRKVASINDDMPEKHAELHR